MTPIIPIAFIDCNTFTFQFPNANYEAENFISSLDAEMRARKLKTIPVEEHMAITNGCFVALVERFSKYLRLKLLVFFFKVKF